MTALKGQHGAHSRSYKKAIVTHSGCCLSPRLREFLCGTPRTVLTEDAFDEDVLLSILPERLIVAALQVRWSYLLRYKGYHRISLCQMKVTWHLYALLDYPILNRTPDPSHDLAT